MESMLLEARQVTKSFNGVPALKGASLSLSAGSVHALCGGNGAGKSTFLGILMGLLRRDGGDIRIRGEAVDFRDPFEAIHHKVAIVTQELSPVLEMTVSENIYLGTEPRRGPWLVHHDAMKRDAQALLERLNFDIDAGARMSALSLAQIQLVEIAKALRRDADILILDEPTSAIGENEAHILFNAVRSLAHRGAGIIYVSHRLSEIFEIADSYTVLRDGSLVESGAIAAIDRSHLVHAIVGRELPARHTVRGSSDARPLLEVSNLTRTGEFEDISLAVRMGEAVGIHGLMGSGRTELLNAVYGLSTPTRGSTRIEGKPLTPGRPRASIRAGLAMVTEDRKDSGLVLGLSIGHNLSMAALGGLQRFGLLRRALEHDLVRRLVQRLQIKTASVELPVASMSGGNQQKVVLGRCLSTTPRLLICDEPTRGIDEGAKQEIYSLLDEFVGNGGGLLVVSSEMSELLQICDRILVFKAGRLVGVVEGEEMTPHALTHLSS